MRIFWLAGTAAIALAPCAAIAQTDPQEGAAPSENARPNAAPEDSIGISDIIVTAQRREESAQKAAVAINVIGGSDVTDAGVTQVANLGSLVPALTVQQIGGSTSTFIRGVGNFSVSITSDPAVAFNYDGVYVGRITATNGTFYDLARIEVLKGPQGTLYGRNATAGVINVIPQQPKPGEFSGYANASYGNYNAINVEGAVNVPLGETGAFRLSGVVTDHDGYLSNGVSDDRTRGLRAQFKVEPSDNLSIRLAGDWTHLGGKGPGFTWINRQVFNAATGTYTVTPTNIPRSQSFLSPASQAFFQGLGAGAIGQVRRTRDPFPDIFRDNDYFGANAEIIWTTGAGTLTIEPAIRFDTVKNRNAAGGFPINNDQKDYQQSIETRFAGNIGIIDYTLGFYYFDENVQLRAGTVTFDSNLNFSAPGKLDTTSYAPFARVTAHVTDALRLVGGVRYTHDNKKIDSTGISLVYNCSVPFTCTGNQPLPPSISNPGDLPFPLPAVGQTILLGPAGPGTTTVTRTANAIFKNDRNFHKVTYRGAVEYDIAPASMLYASVETGFRSGGFNTAVGLETFQPETLTAYTLGAKNRFFDNRVQLNIEAFYWKYQNQQVAHPGVDRGTPPRAGSIVENVGRSTIKGVEVEGTIRATPTTTLSADVQYLDARQKFFQYSVPVAQRVRTNCLVTNSTTQAGFLTINCSGLPSYNSPKWTVNLAAEQRVPLGDYELVIGADTQYKTKRYMGFEYQPEQIQHSSWTSNAQVSFGPSDNRWSVGAFVRNIENNRLYAVPFTFGNILTAYTTPPRTYGVRGSVKF